MVSPLFSHFSDQLTLGSLKTRKTRPVTKTWRAVHIQSKHSSYATRRTMTGANRYPLVTKRQLFGILAVYRLHLDGFQHLVSAPQSGYG